MKKRIISLCLVLVLLATAVIGGTLAYFTDTESATNTFTVGNVQIDLIDVFEQGSKLKPGIDISKEVSVKNTGNEDAYIFIEWLIPTALDTTDGDTGTYNVLHFNSPGAYWDKYRENSAYWGKDQTAAVALEDTWDFDPEVELGLQKGPQGYFEPETIDGISYNKYVAIYHGAIAPDEETNLAFSNAYLDTRVDYVEATDSEEGYYTMMGEKIDFDFTGDINLIVRAYGIQAAGIQDAYAAYNTYWKNGK